MRLLDNVFSATTDEFDHPQNTQERKKRTIETLDPQAIHRFTHKNPTNTTLTKTDNNRPRF